MNLGGWQLSEPDERGDIHIVPVNDLEEHMDEDCKCNPVRLDGVLNVLTHNSFDGREQYETGESKLS